MTISGAALFIYLFYMTVLNDKQEHVSVINKNDFKQKLLWSTIKVVYMTTCAAPVINTWKKLIKIMIVLKAVLFMTVLNDKHGHVLLINLYCKQNHHKVP